MNELFPYIAGVVLSLVFSYFPGLSKWYDGLASNVKRLVMLGLILVVAGAYFGLSCTSWAADLGIDLACTEDGFKAVVLAFVQILIANQATYLASPK